MRRYRHIYFFALSCILYVSCDLKPFDSEAIPVSETQYFSAVVPPKWIQNQGIFKVALTPEFNVDSLLDNLDLFDQCNLKIFCLENIIDGVVDSTQENSRLYAKDYLIMDSLIGNHEKLSQLLRLGKIKNMKFILDWHGIFQEDDSPNSFDRNSNLQNISYKNTLESIDYFKSLGFNGIVCHDMDAVENDLWEMVYEEVKQDTNFVLMGDSKNSDWLNNSFHFLVETKNPHSATLIQNSTYTDLRNLKQVWYSTPENMASIDVLGHYRNHYLLNKTFNGPAYFIDLIPKFFKSTWKDTICSSFQIGNDIFNPLHSIFTEGVSTTMDIDQSLTVIRKYDDTQELRLVINNDAKPKTYYSSTPYMFTDLVTDSVTTLNLEVPGFSYRLVYNKK